MNRQRLKKLALRVGIPLTLYITTKDWGFDIKKYLHKEEPQFAELYKNSEKAGSLNDKIKGGSNIEGAFFGRDHELSNLTISITKFPYSKETLEEKTSYYINLLGDRRFALTDVDNGRYIFTVSDKNKKTRFARILDVKAGKDYFTDVEMKKWPFSLVQKLYTGLTKLRYNISSYLTKKRYIDP